MTAIAQPQIDPAAARNTLRPGALGRFYEAVLWRRRVATEQAFVRRCFRDGDPLWRAHVEHQAITEVTLRDGRRLVHPDRIGLIDTLIELWHHRGYTQGLYRPKPGDTVIDAGANVGVFSAYLLRACPSLRMLPIEPAEENFGYLAQNLKAFGGDVQNITAAALGPEPGDAEFMIADRSLDHRVVAADAQSNDPSARIVKVPVVTLDEVMDKAGVKSVALLKLDIESAEYALLDGLCDKTLRRFERIAIEPHPEIVGRPAKDLIRRISPLFDVRWYGPLIQARRR